MTHRTGPRRTRFAFGLASAATAATAVGAMVAPSPPLHLLGMLGALSAVGLAAVALLRGELLPVPISVLALAGLTTHLVTVALTGWLIAHAVLDRTVAAPAAIVEPTAHPAAGDDLTRATGDLRSGRHVVLRVESTSKLVGVSTRVLTDGDGVWIETTERAPYHERRPLHLLGRGRDAVSIEARPADTIADTTIRCSISIDGHVVVEQEARGPRAGVLCTASD